ncbi:hypothetical protein [Corallococcus carmarthensis]|uniref:VCBS repeat-containing protein n=1 Tax=Corallococcus carmarthensis TaxID=2316728 RepID=A0A3A8K6X3_9BACT|nr:hypothetical protein [Corallococcus carmarthensis]NOK21546.1 hypothetical protein [Corallococcus carmarthensis]RKG97553.1 hypothetical protein D7X32_32365 [Corallococcus carmarthensis]
MDANRWAHRGVLLLLVLVGGLCGGCPEPPLSDVPDARFSTPVFEAHVAPDGGCDVNGDGHGEALTVDAPTPVTVRCLGDWDGDGYADVAVLPRDDTRAVYLFRGGPTRSGDLSLDSPDAVYLDGTENMSQP